MDLEEIDARTVKRALETTQGAPDDPTEVQEKIRARREKLEALNDEVEQAERDLDEAQRALVEEEMKELSGQEADVAGAEQAVKEAREALEDARSMLQARADALKSSIEELEGERVAAEVRQQALRAKEVNEKAARKMEELYEKVRDLKDLNQEVAALCEEAHSINLDAGNLEVRRSGRRRNGQEVKSLFLEGLNEDGGRYAPVTGSAAGSFLSSAEAMFEEGDSQYWPSTMRDQLAEMEGEGGFSLSDLLPS